MYLSSFQVQLFTLFDFLLSFTCYQLWPVYPTSNVNYFWPTPAFLVTQLRDTELDTLQLNISKADPRQRILFHLFIISWITPSHNLFD